MRTGSGESCSRVVCVRSQARFARSQPKEAIQVGRQPRAIILDVKLDAALGRAQRIARAHYGLVVPHAEPRRVTRPDRTGSRQPLHHITPLFYASQPVLGRARVQDEARVGKISH